MRTEPDRDLEWMRTIAKLADDHVGELAVGAWSSQSSGRSRLHLIRRRTRADGGSSVSLCGILCTQPPQKQFHGGPCRKCVRVAKTHLGAIVDVSLLDAHADYIYLRRSIRELAADFGVSPETVRERFKRAGLPTRSSEEANRAMGDARRASAGRRVILAESSVAGPQDDSVPQAVE